MFAKEFEKKDLDFYLKFLDPVSNPYNGIIQPLRNIILSWSQKKDLNKIILQEYTYLFLLPGGVKPYESVYRGDEPLLMQEPWEKVKSFYHRFQWYLDNSYFHPEDHVSVELSFMVYLISFEDPGTEETFFKEHLDSWVPKFFQDMQRNKYASFYKSIAEYGFSFLEKEKQLFSGEKH